MSILKPVSRARSSVLAYLAFQRQMRTPSGADSCVRLLVAETPGPASFSRRIECTFREAPHAAHLALRGRAQPKQKPEGRIIRIEFTSRSVGLGADLRPVSWVLDEEGITTAPRLPRSSAFCKKQISTRCWSNVRDDCVNGS
jgi:hypothetical protein